MKPSRMEDAMKDITLKVTNKVKANIPGLMDLIMKGNGIKIKIMGLGSIIGLMVASITVIGPMGLWMV